MPVRSGRKFSAKRHSPTHDKNKRSIKDRTKPRFKLNQPLTHKITAKKKANVSIKHTHSKHDQVPLRLRRKGPTILPSPRGFRSPQVGVQLLHLLRAIQRHDCGAIVDLFAILRNLFGLTESPLSTFITEDNFRHKALTKKTPLYMIGFPEGGFRVDGLIKGFLNMALRLSMQIIPRLLTSAH